MLYLFLTALITGIIIKWAYQTDEVLSKDSDEVLNEPGNYPGPMTEIQFWEAKRMNLESLYEQMKADTTKKMASILQLTDSAYFPCYRSMFRNVVTALNEAQDITLFLKPLGVHFEVKSQFLLDFQTQFYWKFFFQGLESTDFPDIMPQFRPLMHCVCLVYSNSKNYNSPARIIVLMQETCNLLIDSARKFLDPASLFQVRFFKLTKKSSNSV